MRDVWDHVEILINIEIYLKREKSIYSKRKFVILKDVNDVKIYRFSLRRVDQAIN